MSEMFSETGTEVNRAKIGGVTELLGDPARKLEKPLTIVRFPGGHVEIARTTDDHYWIHVAVRTETGAKQPGRVIKARIDFAGRYGDDANAVLCQEIARGDVEHIAFMVAAGERSTL